MSSGGACIGAIDDPGHHVALGLLASTCIGDLFFLPGGILNIRVLEHALAHVMDRHEGLRLRVARTDDGLRLTIGPSVAERLVEEIDLVGMTGLVPTFLGT